VRAVGSGQGDRAAELLLTIQIAARGSPAVGSPVGRFVPEALVSLARAGDESDRRGAVRTVPRCEPRDFSMIAVTAAAAELPAAYALIRSAAFL
jgi:hypothetical protein